MEAGHPRQGPARQEPLVSGGGNLYKKGTKVQFNNVSGHRDGYSTACPGAKLYARLGAIRSTAAKYQGRPDPAAVPGRPSGSA